MRLDVLRRTTGVLLLALGPWSLARAGDDPSTCWAGCTAGKHTFAQAGYPQDVAWYARPSESHADIGYWVGGGSAFRGEYPSYGEGTWGWDYRGRFLLHRVVLAWSHRRYQGGTGDYRTNAGPHIPDLPSQLNPAIHPVLHPFAHHEE